MKILISSTYFDPYSSGLSVYAMRLAEGLGKMGHQVVVLTSQYKNDLRLSEAREGFLIMREPVKARLSKGVLMPGLTSLAEELIEWADVVNLHLPQFESILLGKIAKKKGKPVLVTYHCDLVMNGIFDKFAGSITTQIAKQVLKDASLIVQNSLDYAENSPVLDQFMEKVVEVPTPVKVRTVSKERIKVFKKQFGISDKDIVIGLAGRAASEKGYEYLAMALPKVLEIFPDARVIHAGSWKSVVGEEKYQKQLETFTQPFGKKWQSLGFLSNEDFEAFFGACDVLSFTSLNATESFGIVQIEAMAQGTPVLASDLPGVRQPVLQTGLGKIIPTRNPKAVAEAVIELLSKGERARFIPEEYIAKFQQNQVAQHYEELFKLLVKHD